MAHVMSDAQSGNGPSRCGIGLVSPASGAENVARRGQPELKRGAAEKMSKKLEFVGLGEALIDVFEDGTAFLGGAPLNVAVHAHHLLEPLQLGEGIVVSAVGDD